MKQVRAIALFLLVGGCSFFVTYRLSHPPQTPGPQASPQTTAIQCDQSLWQYVYNPGRLQVLDPCISVTGSVEEVRKEADGDVHILFRLDQQFESLLNEKNVSRLSGHRGLRHGNPQLEQFSVNAGCTPQGKTFRIKHL
jgi:hypothetical protein